MATSVSGKELLHLSKSELTTKCKKAKLAINGSKSDMVNRLMEHSTKKIKTKINSNKKITDKKEKKSRKKNDTKYIKKIKINEEKSEDKERNSKRRELLKLNNQTLLKICKEHKVKYDKNRTDEIIEKLLDKMLNKQIKKSHRKNQKVKKLSLTFASDDMKEFKQKEQKKQQTLLTQSYTKLKEKKVRLLGYATT
eukprot:146426_1